MTNKELLLVALVVYVGYRYQRSHRGSSAVDNVYAREAAMFATMDGTNFTQSVWDPVNGQPGYMFGTVPAQGGLSTQTGNLMIGGGASASVFGHL
jgi:hypothetical protein